MSEAGINERVSQGKNEKGMRCVGVRQAGRQARARQGKGGSACKHTHTQ